MKRTLIYLSFLLIVFVSENLNGQERYFRTHIAVTTDNSKMIVSEIWNNSVENYIGYPKSSKLYEFPLDCSKGKELILCDNYEWSVDNKFFSGFTPKTYYNSETYLYNSNGELLDIIQNAYGYSFVLPEYHVFYREYDTITKNRICQLVHFDYKTKSEQVIYSFGEEYTFYHPEDHDGFGFPEPLDFYWGGIRGVIYKITKTDRDDFSGNIMEYETLTFVISKEDRKLKYFIQGRNTGKESLPKDKILKNGL